VSFEYPPWDVPCPWCNDLTCTCEVAVEREHIDPVVDREPVWELEPCHQCGSRLGCGCDEADGQPAEVPSTPSGPLLGWAAFTGYLRCV
jgi:hypothetical protein